MKGNLKRRPAVLIASLMIVAAAMIVSPVWSWGEEADAAVKYLPGVTEEMTGHAYWSDQMKEPDKVLADRDELKVIQESLYNEKEIMMTDLSAWTRETYNGVQQNKDLADSAETDAKYAYESGHIYDDQGHKLSSWDEAKSQYYGSMINNCKDKNPQDEMPVKFAICTKRTALTIFPSDKPLHDDPGDPDYDFKYLARVRVNEPLVLQGVSGDGKYYAALVANVSGWVPAEDIAICSDRQEWLKAWNFPDDETLVVTDDKIYTEDSNYDPQLSHVKLPMGTTLKLAAEEEWSGRINNRSAYNNHVVWMPVRRENGTYDKKLALIGQNRKVSEGYLPMTSANLAKVAVNYLGDAYGWGGMMGTNDCSGYVNDVYKCFGLTLARNTTWQSMQPVKKYDLNGMTKEEKRKIIKTLPVGAVLIWPAHEMLYLGNKGDDLYVISSVSNIYVDGTRTRVRGNVINQLDMSSTGGSDWLSNLTTANVPYLTPDGDLPERKQPDPPKPDPPKPDPPKPDPPKPDPPKPDPPKPDPPKPDPPKPDPPKPDPQKPAMPVVKTCSHYNTKSIEAYWDEVDGADQYKVFWKKTEPAKKGNSKKSNSKWREKTTAKATYTATKLKSRGLYIFRVKALKNYDGRIIESDFSNSVYRYLYREKCNVKAAKKALSVSWERDKKASGYVISCSPSKSMKNAKIIKVKGSKKTSLKIKKLKKGKKYYVRVKAFRKYKGKTYQGELSNKIVKKAK